MPPLPRLISHKASAPNTSEDGAVNIEFKDIRFTVKDRRSGAPLDILKGVSGKVEANKLMVIMGSSGAGKTTLLDVLALNMFGSGVVSGEVLVNGAPRRAKDFSSMSCYVLQRDVLLASSTVRESIMIAALLKLPRSMAHAEKVQRVDDILRELELEGCQHTLIGDEMLGMKGISGGQRRRVSVGIELVKSPRVLFLDEPTSGLDSEMAVSLIDTLVKLARDNRTVCTTIHQPSSLITSMFDDFMLLHAGATAYYGRWADSVAYFASHGCPCPQYVNPTDYYMSVLKDKGDDLVQAWAKQESHNKAALVDLEAAAALGSVDGGLPQLEGPQAEGGGDNPQGELVVAPKVPWWYQVTVLSGRMLRMWWRNPAMFLSEITQYAFMGIFIGLVYLQVNDSLETGVNDRAASLWFAMAVLSFTPSYTAAVVWDKDRLLLRRESQQGMYSVTSWFAARTLTTTPVEIAETALFCVIMYFMVGYVANFVNFMIFVAAFCLFQLVSETVGVACAMVTPSSTYAVLILTFVLLFLLSFSGFLVSDVPVYFRWITKVSYLTYAYAAVVKNEFDDVTFISREGEEVPGSDILSPGSPYASLSQVDNGLSILGNLGVLLAITVGARLLTFGLLYVMYKLKKL